MESPNVGVWGGRQFCRFGSESTSWVSGLGVMEEGMGLSFGGLERVIHGWFEGPDWAEVWGSRRGTMTCVWELKVDGCRWEG